MRRFDPALSFKPRRLRKIDPADDLDFTAGPAMLLRPDSHGRLASGRWPLMGNAATGLASCGVVGRLFNGGRGHGVLPAFFLH
jgi:hypothetical protein